MYVALKKCECVKVCGLEIKPKIVLYNEDYYETA
jgi:hypothetical protein